MTARAKPRQRRRPAAALDAHLAWPTPPSPSHFGPPGWDYAIVAARWCLPTRTAGRAATFYECTAAKAIFSPTPARAEVPAALEAADGAASAALPVGGGDCLLLALVYCSVCSEHYGDTCAAVPPPIGDAEGVAAGAAAVAASAPDTAERRAAAAALQWREAAAGRGCAELMRLWLNGVHNAVNRRTGRPEWSSPEVQRRETELTRAAGGAVERVAQALGAAHELYAFEAFADPAAPTAAERACVGRFFACVAPFSLAAARPCAKAAAAAGSAPAPPGLEHRRALRHALACCDECAVAAWRDAARAFVARHPPEATSRAQLARWVVDMNASLAPATLRGAAGGAEGAEGAERSRGAGAAAPPPPRVSGDWAGVLGAYATRRRAAFEKDVRRAARIQDAQSARRAGERKRVGRARSRLARGGDWKWVWVAGLALVLLSVLSARRFKSALSS